MFRKLLPKKDEFFSLMESSAEKAVEIVEAFSAFLEHPAEGEANAARVKEIEHEADDILHGIVHKLQRTFVTPLDRNEISKICNRMDDIVDLVDGAAQRMYHYDLHATPAPLVDLVEILGRQVYLVREAIHGLSDIKHAEPIRQAIIEINTLENRADRVLRATIGALFREEPDPRQIIKWKEVYEHMEKATDRCEDVADHIENVLLEYS